MSIHDYVIRELEKTKGTWPQVARDAGVSIRTLEKIARKETANPGVAHIQKLYDYFQSVAA